MSKDDLIFLTLCGVCMALGGALPWIAMALIH